MLLNLIQSVHEHLERTFTMKSLFSLFYLLKTDIINNIKKIQMMNHVFNYDVATFLQRLNLAIQILIIFPLVSLFTLPCCKALFISLCLLYVDMKNILGGNSNDSCIHTVSLFVFKRQFPPKLCIKATFSKGRSLAAAFSGVEDTGIYLSCHGGLEAFLWIVTAGDVKLENPQIFRHCIILCNFF